MDGTEVRPLKARVDEHLSYLVPGGPSILLPTAATLTIHDTPSSQYIGFHSWIKAGNGPGPYTHTPLSSCPQPVHKTIIVTQEGQATGGVH